MLIQGFSEWVAVFRVRRGAWVQQGAAREGGYGLPFEEEAESPGVVHQSPRLGYVQSAPGAASPPHQGDSPLQLHPCSM